MIPIEYTIIFFLIIEFIHTVFGKKNLFKEEKKNTWFSTHLKNIGISAKGMNNQPTKQTKV